VRGSFRVLRGGANLLIDGWSWSCVPVIEVGTTCPTGGPHSDFAAQRIFHRGAEACFTECGISPFGSGECYGSF
jgi:hypothetical protein